MIATPVKLWRRQKNVAGLIGVRGKILNFTIIRVPAKAFMKEAPYPVVIVELENKQKMVGQLVDWVASDLKIGKKVVAVLRRTFTADPENIIFYNIKFKPYE
jgi:uncharacterized OB-fold protein